MEHAVQDRILSINPWFQEASEYQAELKHRLPKRFVPRFFDAAGFDNPERVKLIIGPRQSGKSTLIWSILQRHAPESVLFLNAEEPLIQKWADSAAGMVRDISQNFPQAKNVFFEEVQNLPRAGLTLKGLVDAKRGLNIWATGSSSYHLMDRARESLAGRAERRVLLPFSIRELSRFEPSSIPGVQAEIKADLVRRMLVSGSYPGVWFATEPKRELSNLVEALVIRDVSDRFRVQRPDAFRQLLQLLAGQTGQMINFTELAAHLSISVSTVREYVNILEECWLVKLLPAFARGKRREITSASKLHFIDQGIRNALLGATSDDIERRTDKGALLEGLVFAELFKELPPMWTIHYWRAKGGAEVDFVLVLGERLIAVEAKSSARQQLTKSSRSFIEAYAPELFVTVRLGETERTERFIGRTRVISVGIEDLHETLTY